MDVVRIGGVPEHFNYPWYLGLINDHFKAKNIHLRWYDFPGGTGQMNLALENNKIDLAVVLTEGIIKSIVEGNSCKIVQTFVKSPLIWGIHTAPNSGIKNLNELRGKTAAISRYGSGSHLMAYVHGKQLNWDSARDLNFHIINDLDGAIKSISSHETDYFMWEKFTTKPLVDKGIFNFLGECPTPWPCFVIAARNEFIQKEAEQLRTVLLVINSITSKFKTIDSIDQILAQRYNQNINDIQTWLKSTEWSQQQMDSKTVDRVQEQLLKLDIIKTKLLYEDLVV